MQVASLSFPVEVPMQVLHTTNKHPTGRRIEMQLESREHMRFLEFSY